jgi:thymidylate synthase
MTQPFINQEEESYLDLVQCILDTGEESDDRTGVGTLSKFGYQMRFNVGKSFPLLTTKKINFKHIITELLWMISGSTNVAYLHEHGCTIWDSWANEHGELGRIYGSQWRDFVGLETFPSLGCVGQRPVSIDQIAELVASLKRNPNSRRHLVSAWNGAELLAGGLSKPALASCHCLWQCYVRNGKLSLQLYQRSADLMVGVPYNIASYSLLLMMLAQVTGYEAHEFIHTFGDVHIYKNHINGARKQLERAPKEFPQVCLNLEVEDIFSFKHEDIELVGYNPDKFIKFSIAV